ncbi:glycohydrolase toxin TNT-related protein [Arthrobacter crystallopoietes]|uniref:DNA/RNA non-specific endonuclease n=1 Tax=Crystallibacter crystallopoietes TaxID=37928 RepID=A0A1H1ETL7_9MICC|nr:glycohydrolase toxin TNT-related protein [Arthrobacter crystallopoietes]AUI49790.1 hypothetical protein AC20117_02085 [Arthrobacter crystallopoietes]SDQ91859.1 DNA/RNA non-specific endonuclease [Arthrobacter crystallopoietes]
MGWNPSEFPPLPDGDLLEQHAGKLRTKAEGIQSAAEESHTLWAGMSTAYKGPGDWQVHTAFNKVASEAEVVLEDANAVADAIDTFAEWARDAKRRYNALYADWLSVQSRIDDGGGDWREDQDLVNDDNNILKSADALLAEHMEAERTCATAISGLFGGPSYVVTTQDGPGANQVAYGYTADQLDAAAAEGNIPWGEPTEWDKPWYRDALDGVVSFGKGVWSGITGTVTGLWNMVNFTDMETFSATWKGIGTLALDVAIVTSPVAQVALRATGNKHIVDQSAERLVAVGKAAVHWDDWKRDPAYAAGASAFDLASILLTAGGGAVAKTGSVASAVTRVGSTGSRVASVVNATGLTKIAGYTGRVIDLGSALKINTVNFATDTARVTLGRVAPAAVRVDNFINDVGTSLSGPRPAYAGVPTGNGPGPVSTRIDNLINRFDAEGPSSPNRGTAPDTTPARGTSTPEPALARDTNTPDAANRPSSATDSSTSAPASQRPTFEAEGQRIDDNYRHPARPANGVEQPDVIKDPAGHKDYGQHRDDMGLQDRNLEGNARYPEEINGGLAGIVDENQPKFGVDENGRALTEQEYANRYGEINPKTGDLEWDSYPDNAGAVDGSIRHYDSLDGLRQDFGEDLTFDRIGHNGGTYLAVDGTPWHMRSLPVNTLGKELHHFELNELPDHIKVEVSEIAPAFGRPGGGTQIQFVDSRSGRVLGVNDMLNQRVLTETGPLRNPAQDLIDEVMPKVYNFVDIDAADAPGPRTPWSSAGQLLERNTKYSVPGHGRFYTDENGAIKVVEAAGGTGKLNPNLQNPLPDTTYRVNDNVVYRTDADGNTAETHIVDYRKDTGIRSEGVQSAVGRTGMDEIYPDLDRSEIPSRYHFDGGHLHGTDAGGIPERINLQPMLRQLNQSLGGSESFWRFERTLINAAERARRIEVDIYSEFDGGKTPVEFYVEYTIDGVKQAPRLFINRK